MEDLAARGRAADESIKPLAPAAARAATVAEALLPPPEQRSDPLPEHAGKPALVLGGWNELR